jgi:hypothetical protein
MPMKKYKPEQIVTLLRQNEPETKMKQRIVSRLGWLKSCRGICQRFFLCPAGGHLNQLA